MKSKTFKELVRENTGTHFLDSGGDGGRHWQRPLPQDEPWLEASSYTDRDGNTTYEILGTIPTHAFLDYHLEIDQELTELISTEPFDNDWVGTCRDELAEHLGYEVGLDAENTYNCENDLSQDFQFSVLVPQGSTDWVYANDPIILIQTHNGADVRGGYSDVVVCRLKSDMDGLCYFFNWTCGFSAYDGIDADGDEMDHDECQSLDEHWQVGYSSYPAGQLRDDIESIVDEVDNYKPLSEVTVKLKTGETVKVCPSTNMY